MSEQQQNLRWIIKMLIAMFVYLALYSFVLVYVCGIAHPQSFLAQAAFYSALFDYGVIWLVSRELKGARK